MAPLNLGRLQEWIDAGRIDTSRVITMKDLLDSRAVHQIKFGVKLLADVGKRGWSQRVGKGAIPLEDPHRRFPRQ